MKSLRPYQQEAINAIHNGLERGLKSMLVVLPTGCGKTFMAVEAIKDMGRVLWISHTQELCSQSASALIGCDVEFDNLPPEIGLIKAEKFDIEPMLVMAMAQSLHRRLDRIPADHFDVIVCDEADLFLAKTFVKSIEYFTPKLLLGLTATPFRQDNMPLTDVFEEIVYEYEIIDAVKQGYLCKPDAIRVKTNTSLDNVKTQAGEFKQGDLSNTINTPARNYQIVNKYLEYCEGRQFMAFSVDVQHAQDLCDAFKEKGINCDFVVGDTELSPDRRKVIESFKNGQITGLTNCMILSVGFNYDDVGACIMACPTKSRRKYIQQLGRGLRLKSSSFTSKFGQNCIILDIVDGTRKHKLINTEEIDKDYDLEDKLFISEENRQKLLDVKARREQQLNVVLTDVDERVVLLPLPRRKLVKTARMNEEATPAQLRMIAHWGYDVENVNYSKYMVGEIVMSQPASQQEFENVASCGFDVSNGVTVAEAKDALLLINEMDSKKR